ncbi:lysosomal thioesterase PPT2 isoform X2 [Hemicordylus capensis]|nr:lysosomal thioesterase PPT2 isoform X2 [Hemicordylus capensis]XP_053151578.1 lysosomal thioesterase PPT2 isoform X2 [Hemicordylus capensis]XP_053151579.1 lysosomal thioesterase PPT2 isoform X2 [Hemicordylus capensis]XP_053151581.1 lysosomal thioesterase PPT2 isoform X2 [Hemicordylus capensis]XP_053151582.1 lysosomal thioesterase PPT2 isoform X2 [Hemicordylus capensis]XP_053151583.1 lysosomal thioesterase PPT2 isoform X2 [Hemicordylus capensis]
MRQYQGYVRVLAPFCILVLFLLLTLTASYKPIIVVHGLFDSPSEFQILKDFINETHPGTNVTVVDLFDRSASLQPLWKQVEGFRQAIHPIMQNAGSGVHLICYSQGGLICRALLSTMPDHNVDTFISLSSPQMGQYGDTKYLKWLFPQHVKSNLYRLCYTQFGQDFSICNYWNDPHHRDLYLNSSNFLALLNDEKLNPNATDWKKNFLRIRKMVLIGGPDDGVIMPWQSSLFSFYDKNETVTEMHYQPVYLEDTFGLKTLDARGDIVFYTMRGVAHTFWHSNRTVYDTCIAKWLT